VKRVRAGLEAILEKLHKLTGEQTEANTIVRQAREITLRCNVAIEKAQT
jgi:hypothetical protein